MLITPLLFIAFLSVVIWSTPRSLLARESVIESLFVVGRSCAPRLLSNQVGENRFKFCAKSRKNFSDSRTRQTVSLCPLHLTLRIVSPEDRNYLDAKKAH